MASQGTSIYILYKFGMMKPIRFPTEIWELIMYTVFSVKIYPFSFGVLFPSVVQEKWHDSAVNCTSRKHIFPSLDSLCHETF